MPDQDAENKEAAIDAYVSKYADILDLIGVGPVTLVDDREHSTYKQREELINEFRKGVEHFVTSPNPEIGHLYDPQQSLTVYRSWLKQAYIEFEKKFRQDFLEHKDSQGNKDNEKALKQHALDLKDPNFEEDFKNGKGVVWMYYENELHKAWMKETKSLADDLKGESVEGYENVIIEFAKKLSESIPSSRLAALCKYRSGLTDFFADISLAEFGISLAGFNINKKETKEEKEERKARRNREFASAELYERLSRMLGSPDSEENDSAKNIERNSTLIHDATEQLEKFFHGHTREQKERAGRILREKLEKLAGQEHVTSQNVLDVVIQFIKEEKEKAVPARQKVSADIPSNDAVTYGTVSSQVNLTINLGHITTVVDALSGAGVQPTDPSVSSVPVQGRFRPSVPETERV